MTFLKVYYDDGYVLAKPECEQSIDAAVSAWVDSGKTRDRLLRIELLDGCELAVLASEVTSWLISTPETRQRQVEIERDLRAEDTAMRQAAGIWDED